MSPLLAAHVATGAAALLLAPLALTGRAVLGYRLLVGAVALTALPLAVVGDLPAAVRVALAVVALATAAAVVGATPLALRASVVSLLAATAFVSAPLWLAVLVVLAGSAWAHTSRAGAAPGAPGPAAATATPEDNRT